MDNEKDFVEVALQKLRVQSNEREEIGRLRSQCESLCSECVELRYALADAKHGPGKGTDPPDAMSLMVCRGGWLSVFLLSLSLTSLIMHGFESSLQKHIELALFVPLLIGHGGNAGGQSVGAVLGAIAAGDVGAGDWARVIARECLMGLGAGALTDIAVLPLFWVMEISSHVAAAILVTLPALTVLAAFLGSSLPFLCSYLGADPEVIAAPAMSTLVDVGGTLMYFLITTLVFRIYEQEM